MNENFPETEETEALPKEKKRSPRIIGDRWERAARKFLRDYGYKILGKNYQTREGEIDIIAYDRETGKTVFVEVKSRNDDPEIRARYGRPADAVNPRKKARFYAAVRSYQRKSPDSLNCRFDIIEVYFSKKPKLFEKPRIVHLKSAFGKVDYSIKARRRG